MSLCPCGSSLKKEECCAVFISGKANAPTAEALMRSRYTAFTEANMDYFGRTMKAPAATLFHPAETKQWAKSVEWLGLKVIHAETEHARGCVEFMAFFAAQGKRQVLHEKSEFILENGQWFYIDGITPHVGRNDACPCGSGKKYKKCCAN